MRRVLGNGNVLGGPAPSPLRHFDVVLDMAGNLRRCPCDCRAQAAPFRRPDGGIDDTLRAQPKPRRSSSMDLIASLTSQLGLDPDKAQGLAGTALGLVQEQIGEKLGTGAAGELANALPELSGWVAQAKALSSGGSEGGGLMGLASGLLGGGDVGGLIKQVSGLGLDASVVQGALPLVLDFLKSRLSPELMEKVQSAVPWLKGLSGGGGLGGALGGLGGLLGG